MTVDLGCFWRFLCPLLVAFLHGFYIARLAATGMLDLEPDMSSFLFCVASLLLISAFHRGCASGTFDYRDRLVIWKV